MLYTMNKFLKEINNFLENWTNELKILLLTLVSIMSLAVPNGFNKSHPLVFNIINVVSLISISIIEAYILKKEKNYGNKK